MSFALIFRVVVMLALAAHVFYMYCTARGISETVGFRLGTTVIACLFALAMLIPLVWAVFLPDLPEFFSQHLIPRRRWERGRCPACGYDMRGLAERSTACPECGSPSREPAGWEGSARTVRRFVAINMLAWAIGCLAAEIWMQIDENDFQREVERRLAAGNTSNWGRGRHWPNTNCSLVYRYPDGIHATD